MMEKMECSLRGTLQYLKTGCVTCDRRLYTDEVFADAFADTVPVDTTLFLLAANLLIIGIAKETFRAGTDGLMAQG